MISGGKGLNFASLIGLSREKRKAITAIRACRHSGMVFPHTLLYGVGGTGKTAFARAISSELGYFFVETHGAAFKKRDDLLEALLRHSAEATQTGLPLFFFIDEVHRLKYSLQEALYSAMKEWWIPTAHKRIEIPPFTLIAATTRFDMLDSNSFVTRFGNVWEIHRYSVSDIASIVAQEFRKLGLSFNRQVVFEVAKRCLGIPRIAITLADKVRMTVLASGGCAVTMGHALESFRLEEIDGLGLSPVHRRYLQILSMSRSSGRYAPLGVGAIAAKMRQQEDVIKGSVEPILLEFDFVAPTPRGRVLTDRGAEYLEKVQKNS